MKIKLLKFFTVGAFMAFAACAFFVSGGNKIGAENMEAARKKAGILEKVADYKTWKQIVKPVVQTIPGTFTIDNSSGFG